MATNLHDLGGLRGEQALGKTTARRCSVLPRAALAGVALAFMNYIVYSHALERVAAEGSGLIVYYDYGNSKSCEVPEEIVSAIQDLQGRG